MYNSLNKFQNISAIRLCQSLDNKLHALLEDASHYIVDNDTPEEGSTVGSRTIHDDSDVSVFGVDPFDKFADREAIVSFIQSAGSDCVHRYSFLFINSY